MKKKKSRKSKRPVWFATEKAKRPFNEDALLVKESHFAIADGHGQTKGETENAGSIASQETVVYFSEKFTLESQSNSHWTPDRFRQFFERHSSELKSKLYELCHQYEPPLYSGTTLEFVHINEASILFAHVGDSRIYVITNDSEFKQITTDETIAQQLITMGKIDKNFAKVWSRNFVLTNSISPDSVSIQCISELRRQDIRFLLMATDGMTDKLLNKEIHDCILKNNFNTKTIVNSLIKQAKNPSQDLFKIYILHTDQMDPILWINDAHDMKLIQDSEWERIGAFVASNLYLASKKINKESLNQLVPSLQYLYSAYGDSDLVVYIIYQIISNTSLEQAFDFDIVDDSIKDNTENLNQEFETIIQHPDKKIGYLILEIIESSSKLLSYIFNRFVNYYGGNDNISVVAIDVNNLDISKSS